MQQTNTLNEQFVEMEKKWLQHWYESGIISKYLQKNAQAEETFSFLDGPITANNPMGVHHAWGRTYKDLWQKFHNLLGHKQRFQNGFDCQGLWVEVEVEKDLKLKNKKDIENLIPGDKQASVAKFVQLCKDRVKKFSEIQTDQSKRLGYFMDWDNSYFTMSDENNYTIWHFLKQCYEHGWLYKGQESVPWCPRCETAISQHEMLTEDYKEVVHESIYLEFPIVGREREFLLVWTTTPWTIPANVAVAVDKKLDYILVEGSEKKRFWVAKDTFKRVFTWGEEKIIKTVKGEDLVGLQYTAPFDDLPAVKKTAKANKETFHTVIATDNLIMPITTDEGTGLVHTAVSAGTQDYKLGKKYGLPMIPVIADNADYLEGLGFLTGQNAKKNPRLILDYLEKKDKEGDDCVFLIEKYKHRYPGCWRCKAELVWKVADEWYIAMDKLSMRDKKDKRTLRKRMIDVAKKITWMPSFGLDRELDWLKNMHDWLISKKNRYWGLALPIYECNACGTFDVIGSKEELQKRAVEGWSQLEGKSPHKPYIDEVKIACKKCKKPISRILDVGNPWLDAGIVPFSTISADNTSPLYPQSREEWSRWFPADFITESFPGQFKNWFYALIAMSTVLEDENPFKRVLGFATLFDEHGRAMHKSWGNAIEFNEGADIIGVDVMRWMYARQNPGDNLLFGYNKAKEVRRSFYLLLWNSFKYYRSYQAIDNVQITAPLELNDLSHVLDQWIYSYFNATVDRVYEALMVFDSRVATEAIESFVTDLSTWYIRRSRNRTGASSQDSDDKRDFYSTMYYVLTNLAIVVSPFLPFISEEMYTHLTNKDSVHLASWPEIASVEDDNLLSDMQLIRAVAEVGHRARKELKIKVRQPLALATVTLSKNQSLVVKENLDQYLTLLQDELNVKQIQITDAPSEEITVSYDTDITPELKLEGELRELIRSIQQQRKKLGARIGDSVKLILPEQFMPFEEEIVTQTRAEKVSYGGDLVVEL
ncbi:isoleucine--tRNA ligase [Candidatus Woesebacteria bacterium]|nr:isoleucine--tRNA ligase [Candidatus Woesebacteria bacterium]